jgi:hypothetical protein
MEPTVNVLIVISLFELAVISLFTDGGRQSKMSTSPQHTLELAVKPYHRGFS